MGTQVQGQGTTAVGAPPPADGNATADDLIKLQLEQERHNRMLQMVQADRQERAMLANQEALFKQATRNGEQGGVSPEGEFCYSILCFEVGVVNLGWG